MVWFQSKTLMRNPVRDYVVTKSFRLDQIESTNSYGKDMQINMMSGDKFVVDADDAKRLADSMGQFRAGYKNVMAE